MFEVVVDTLEVGGTEGLDVLAVLDPTKSPSSNGSLNQCGKGLLVVAYFSVSPAVDEIGVVVLPGTSLETKKVMPVSSS